MKMEGGQCGQWEHKPCHDGHDAEHERFHMMMSIAKSAKMELLKEKIKKKIEAAEGKKLDEIATIIADMLMEKQKMKMGIKKKKHEMKKRIEELLMED